MTLKDGPGSVTCEDSNGNSVAMEPAGITIKAASKVKVEAATVEVSAGMVTVDTAMAKFSGVVKCEIADRDVGGLDQLHARRGEHLVRARR